MSEVEFRKAAPSELDQVYMMGFELWNEGLKEPEYLHLCRTLPKYDKGTWYVLAKDEQLLSSLIIYTFGNQQFGFGSIATPKSLRKQGFASQMITASIDKIKNENDNPVIFLYSDIDPKFYEKFDFFKLPQTTQRYKNTICMVWGKNIEMFLSDKIATPEYF
jgi:predicted GNAT family acetyltransferase